MTISNRGKVILRTRNPAIEAISHQSRLLTITNTMNNGSLLVGNLEATSADNALVDGVINDPKFDEGFYKEGESHLVSVCFGAATADSNTLTFSDKKYSSEPLPILSNKGMTIVKVATDYSLVLSNKTSIFDGVELEYIGEAGFYKSVAGEPFMLAGISEIEV